MIKMKAVILAAGEGTRIREITGGKIPKPMIDIGPGPLIAHTVNKLCDFGVSEIIINLHYKGDEIKDYFGDEWNGVTITYSEEDNLLGTAGGLKKVEELLSDTFLLFYGDVLTDLDLEEFVEDHRKSGSDSTVLVYREEQKLTEASIILTDEDNHITEFLEKPSESEIKQYKGKDFWTNGAVFVMEPEIFDYIPDGFSDLSKDVFPKAVESKDFKFSAYPLPENTYWREVGNPRRYRKARKDIQKGRIDFKG